MSQNLPALSGSKIAGIQALFFIEVASIDVWPDSEGLRTLGDVQLLPGQLWSALQGQIYTAALGTETEVGPHGATYAQELAGFYIGDAPAIARQFAAMNGKRYVLLYRDHDGATRLVGDERGGIQFSYKYDSGTRPGARKGYAWSFKGRTAEPARFYEGQFEVDELGMVPGVASPSGQPVRIVDSLGNLLLLAQPGSTVVVPSGGASTFGELTDSPYDHPELGEVLTGLEQTLEGTIDVVENIAQIAVAAGAAAAAAQETADGAQSLADYALQFGIDATGYAYDAQQSANQAQETADAAQLTADTAATASGQAVLMADAAQSTANEALNSANDANSTAGGALSTAEGALQLATQAVETANTAGTAADAATEAAGQASSDAAEALAAVALLTPLALPIDQTLAGATTVDMSHPNQYRNPAGALVWNTLTGLGRCVPVYVMLFSTLATDTFTIGTITLSNTTPLVFTTTLNGELWTINLIGGFIDQIKQRVTLQQNNTHELTLHFEPLG